jgi:mono/diheme cytochrome c family protein
MVLLTGAAHRKFLRKQEGVSGSQPALACAMQKPWVVRSFVALVVLLSVRPAARTGPSQEQPVRPSKYQLALRETRSSPMDLEISFSGRVHFLSREDLQKLPQESFSVSDDSNFAGSTEIRGVRLDTLTHALFPSPDDIMAVAVCDDLYRAHYPQAYIRAHHPVLVLEVNGQPPQSWPQSKEGGEYLGPYLISHPKFTPSFKVLAHQDEPQIPWGVLRLEFHNEAELLNSIEPLAPLAIASQVRDGFRIAQQNCWRCHGPQREGPQKGKLTWEGIGAVAATAPRNFANYVRNPQQVSPSAQMPGNPQYDEATLQALTAYFRTFFHEDKP